MPGTARHETRALLRAHLSAASGYRHLTRRCPVCQQIQRLAMEPSQHPVTAPPAPSEDPQPDHPLQTVQQGDEGPCEA
jgi:hypothetical protein